MGNRLHDAKQQWPYRQFSVPNGTQPNGAHDHDVGWGRICWIGQQERRPPTSHQEPGQEVSIRTQPYGAEFAKRPVTLSRRSQEWRSQVPWGALPGPTKWLSSTPLTRLQEQQGRTPARTASVLSRGDLGGPVDYALERASKEPRQAVLLQRLRVDRNTGAGRFSADALCADHGDADGTSAGRIRCLSGHQVRVRS